jgi:hypothetical protein
MPNETRQRRLSRAAGGSQLQPSIGDDPMQKLTDVLPNTDAMDTVDLMTYGEIGENPDEPTDPGWRNAVSRRIVEVTDEDENLIPEFVSLDPHPFAFR